MEEFLSMSAIYLFAAGCAGTEDPEELRRALRERMPDVAIGEIRKLPESNMYQVRVD